MEDGYVVKVVAMGGSDGRRTLSSAEMLDVESSSKLEATLSASGQQERLLACNVSAMENVPIDGLTRRGWEQAAPYQVACLGGLMLR